MVRAHALRVVVLAVATLSAACEPRRGGPAVPGSRATEVKGRKPLADASPWFEEVARERGLVFVAETGHRTDYLLPEAMGGGVALFDMDGDGDLDVFLTQGGGLVAPSKARCGLFRNDGSGRFEDVSAGSGADIPGHAMGVACGDVDDDGDVDLYVTRVGANVLLLNDGTGRFEDVSERAGVAHAGWGASAAFFDADGDGDLDLFVVNYVHWSADARVQCVHCSGSTCFNTMGAPDFCHPNAYAAPAMDVLYRNDGGGRFVDVTQEAGIGAAFGNGLGVTCLDVNGDGWQDVFVANDTMPNQLWINQGPATPGAFPKFRDRAMILGCAVDESGRAKAGMGVAADDVDGDGDVDLLVVNLRGESDSFYRRQGAGFIDATTRTGLSATNREFTRFGVGFMDFDLDGCLDLYQANGRVMRHESSWSDDPYAEPNVLFRGRCDATFEVVLPAGGTAQPLVRASLGAAFGDVDGDGAADVVVSNRDAPVSLLRNVVEGRGSWALVRLVEASGRDALGATLRGRVGARTFRRDCRAAFSYCSSSDPRIHVGLGDEQSLTDVVVTWVDGTLEHFADVAAGTVTSLRRGEGGPPPL